MEEWSKIEELLPRVVAMEEGAWASLLTVLSPVLGTLVRRQPIGRLRDDEDAQRDIVTKVIGKLHRGDHAVVKKYVGHETPPPLQAWVRVLVRSAAIDVMRGRPEFKRGNKETLPGWFSLATLVTRDGSQKPDSLELKQREVEQFLRASIDSAQAAIRDKGEDAASHLAKDWNVGVVHTRRLIKRIAEYQQVLAMILAGHTYREVAEATGLSSREVELVVGYIEEFLRARGFADE